ncbi:MAG TPA: helix-turn-helix transcriptional regulator [Opitutaceae bacterium]|nr:helix-turn-helix transcriptional regulator [Opitutaceae bacterium]
MQVIEVMYGRILRHLRESKGRSQAEVAKAVAISPAHLARLEAEQRGLYVKDFVTIAEALGEKPGNLLPNDVGAMGHVKPLVDRLAVVPPELLPHVTAILAKVIVLAESVVMAAPSAVTSRPEPPPASRRKGRN